jgi:tellurite resistance protein TerC
MTNHLLTLALMVLVGGGFCIYMFVKHGQTVGEAWSTCYLLEYAQSVDALFSLHIIFKAFAVPKENYVKVMTCGMYLAMLLRLLFFANLYLFGRLDYLTNLVVGIILIIIAFASFIYVQEEVPVEERPAVMFWKAALGSRLQAENYSENGDLFTTDPNTGKLQATMLFILVLVIGFVDLTLSLDNVATQQFEIKDVFIMSTSCVFAMFALRSIFFIVMDAGDLFEYRQYGFAAVLLFCAFQMIVSKWIVLPIIFPLLVVAAVCVVSLLASALTSRGAPKSEEAHESAAAGNPQDDK